jgi:hypothetical protein
MINAFVVVNESSEKTNTDDLKGQYKKNLVAITSVLAIILLWGALGIAAFFMSLFCFGRSGTTTQHIFGFVLAIFLGPFYWIYYGLARTYCLQTNNL